MTEPRVKLAAGMACEREVCAGVLYVYKTKVIVAEDMRVRYLKCDRCGHLPDDNLQSVPLEYAPARPSRVTSRQK
jgi:hypothetical protein